MEICRPDREFMPRHRVCLILIGAAALFLFIPRPVRAQQSPAISTDSDDAEDEKTTPMASLTITPSETGRARVNFHITAVEPYAFSTAAEQITAIVLGPGVPGLLANRRIYIAWKDPELGRSGTLNIGCIESDSILEIRRKTTQLEGVLQNWWQASADARPLPAQLAELTSPLIGAVTSVAPDANWRFGRILKELWLTGVIAAIAAVLCGLRFQLVAYLFSTPATRVVSAAFVHSPRAGWYVVCVAVVLRGPALVPFLRYKDKSFVAAPTLGVPPPPAPNASSPYSKSESGTVLAR